MGIVVGKVQDRAQENAVPAHPALGNGRPRESRDEQQGEPVPPEVDGAHGAADRNKDGPHRKRGQGPAEPGMVREPEEDEAAERAGRPPERSSPQRKPPHPGEAHHDSQDRGHVVAQSPRRPIGRKLGHRREVIGGQDPKQCGSLKEVCPGDDAPACDQAALDEDRGHRGEERDRGMAHPDQGETRAEDHVALAVIPKGRSGRCRRGRPGARRRP